MPADYYDVLGLAHVASQDEIKKQYKKLARVYHPDKTQDKEHHKRFLLIREAYDTLKDEDSRQKYNREAGIGVSSTSASTYTSARGQGFGAEFPSYARHQFSRASYGDASFGSSFFDFYQRSSKMYTDHFSRNSRREAAKEAEDKAAMYAEIARQKMQEDQERRQEEYIKKARKEREEEALRQQMEEKLRKQKEQRMSSQAEQAAQAAQASFARSQGFGDARSAYESAKTEAYRKSRETENARYTSREREDSHEFIVVEDEEPEAESESESDSDSETDSQHDSGQHPEARDDYVKRERAANPSSESMRNADMQTDEEMEKSREESGTSENDPDGARFEFGDTEDEGLEGEKDKRFDGPVGDNQEEDEDNVTGSAFGETMPPSGAAEDHNHASFLSESTQYATPRQKPEVVEIPEESDLDNTFYDQNEVRHNDRRQDAHGATQAQAHVHAQESDAAFDKKFRDAYKKPRLSNYSGMRDSLNTYFDDVDFSDIRETLPKYSHRTRKASTSSAAQQSKRARYAEYTDGSSKAETLYTPVNKTYSRNPTASITVSDLSPEMDDISLIFSADVPQLKVGSNTTQTQWNEYDHKILEYQQKFASYRKSVMKYQMGRLDKDERHHNIIYSDTTCLDVYQSCLFNDVLLLQNYTRALQEFRQTLKLYHVNLETVNKMMGK